MIEPLQSAAEVVRSRCGFAPEIAIVLGSGLSSLADELDEPVRIPYRDLPGMVVPTAPGHRSEAVAGRLVGRGVLLLRGRFHAYEGYAMEEVTSPVRMIAALGCRRLLLTNAAGGVNERFRPGELMVIADHINLTGMSPLLGAGPGPLDRKADARNEGECWPAVMRESLKAAAVMAGVAVREGIYLWMSGPSFETPAEIRSARSIGADAVGMSTVPEALAAVRLGIRTAGLSLISNMAAGILERPITAEEVMETASAVREELVRLVRVFVEGLPREE